ncbi:flagellar basal-body MS-ring/collar protein FliF [Anaerosinus massiliensis]|uniref:flagellar basal-body MS-ring/collar protein FliF n=1 Tax=Massilibacillus massiliensis TaxID=1806837 RepID=UPI000AC5473F|nr:flagellar basal-body MS-ring/collar protein FliF [Massilibacillus massiliensis]
MADWKEQSLQVWNKLGKRQRYTIMGVAALLMITIFGWSYWWGSKPDMVPLFTGMEAKDAGEVAAKLKEMKIPYEPQESSRGTAILVQAKDVHNARLELATQGLPRGQKGFEIFDDSKLGVTEFQNKVNYLQALQGELTRTIEQLEEVEKARVHIVLPEDSLYKKNEKPATASIMLKLKPNQQLSKQHIKGIVNLVAHSVQGLQAQNITIVDNAGKILNDPEDDEKSVGNATLTQLDMTKKVQDRLQKDLQTFLDQVLGEGKAVARVNVELTFDQRTLDRQVFEPVVDDSGIVRSSQENAESYNGTSAAPGGPAGTTSNIPGYVAANNTQSQYDKKEVTKNFEINESKEKVVAAPGSIKRLTVAVLVDEQMPRNQQDSISRAASSAIGLDTGRGDTISVEAVPFSTELADRQAREDQARLDRENQMFWMKVALGVLVLAMIGAFIYMRRRKARLAKEAEERAALEALQQAQKEAKANEQAAAMESLDEMSPEEKNRMTERQALEELIKTRPEEVAQLVRTWLSEE